MIILANCHFASNQSQIQFKYQIKIESPKINFFKQSNKNVGMILNIPKVIIHVGTNSIWIPKMPLAINLWTSNNLFGAFSN